MEPSTKGYKLYLRRPEIINAGLGIIKYYRWHDNDNPINKFREITTTIKN